MTDIQVEVIFADADDSKVEKLTVPQGSTVAEVLENSQSFKLYLQRYNDISVGIFSKQVELDKIVCEYDRIELYRPLVQDPKQRRIKKINRG